MALLDNGHPPVDETIRRSVSGRGDRLIIYSPRVVIKHHVVCNHSCSGCGHTWTCDEDLTGNKGHKIPVGKYDKTRWQNATVEDWGKEEDVSIIYSRN